MLLSNGRDLSPKPLASTAVPARRGQLTVHGKVPLIQVCGKCFTMAEKRQIEPSAWSQIWRNPAQFGVASGRGSSL